ncbi:MAG: DUF1284 domain-containing protein [Nitrospirae bacterium]|nr:DUF1284 domain-containing protein [Nitrospirota bacterium]
MPLLRGHHLICLNFFNGEGYDEAFIKNLQNLLSRMEEEKITIFYGTDDVCINCPYLKENRCLYSENSDREIMEMDTKALALLALSHGDKVEWSELKEKIRKIFSEWFYLYCKECDWRNACEKNASFQKLKYLHRTKEQQ